MELHNLEKGMTPKHEQVKCIILIRYVALKIIYLKT